jgi:adenylate cyclase
VLYLGLALAFGVRWGVAQYLAATQWLEEDRPPDPDEQRRALREPLRTAAIHAVLWTTAAPLFALLNWHYSGALAVSVGITALLGGFVTSASAFLLMVRLGRPVAARVLAAGVPKRPVLLGITTRAVLAWALGSGVALVGLMLVAAGRLVGRDISGYDMAITVIGLSAVALVVGGGMVLLAARATAEPVLAVRDALERVESGDLDVQVEVTDDSELGLMQAGFNRMVHGLREREQLRDLFGRHVGEDVAREALSGHVELGGEVRDVAVLFVDVIGSTTIAATRPPSEVVELLNAFFDVVVDVVTAHGGWINKFEGDAALAVFGVPIARGDPYAGALAAGRELAARLRTEVDGLEAAIGISAGEVVAGNVGAEQRYEYTVIGDPVNEAARLCELAKSRPARVLASAAILERAEGEEGGRWRLGESVSLRGRTEPTRVAEPV